MPPASSNFTATFWAQLSAVVVSLLAVGIAYAGIRRQSRRAREATGLALLFRLVESWDSKAVRQRRADLARVLEKRTPIAAAGRPPEFDRNAIDVLNSFEYLGFLVVTAKVLTVREARKVLGPWAVGYWLAFQDAFAQLAPDSAAFDQLHALVARILRDYIRVYHWLPLALPHDETEAKLDDYSASGKFTRLTLSKDTLQELRYFLNAETVLAPRGTTAEGAGTLSGSGPLPP